MHGLNGNPYSYWQHDDVIWKDGTPPESFWPAWLGADLPDIAVWSLGYDAAVSAWIVRAMPLVDRATEALATMHVEGIGERPIVFVTPSMGGLLVKQLLQHSRNYGQSHWATKWKQTRGVVFISTPHSGADSASWVDRLGHVFRANAPIEDLRAHDPRLRSLNTWFREHVVK